MKNVLVLGVLGGLLASGSVMAQADLEKHVGGYTKVLVDTKMEQKNPLDKVITFSFPGTIQNVGQALNYVLTTTGYELQDLDETSSEVLRLYTKRLPEVNYGFQHSSVKQVIDVLVGDGYGVSVDPSYRVVRIDGGF